ncbi:Yos1p [Cyberlindnera jadinii NRRL Y-1542]|uniref:Yos1-like protein n=1 Tax=Cyberlindnera jadinii (strain ATCC 18201 / CBS 1600 / BCRC 20928 / JCM 3617 / NBRC 0987 / NRRL Y-1542) TaxID=983966 RepID=A0A1E4S2A6_CYBJN|nr:Yos1-like protein [Cyberlindnera jadinii NRRL Y-1542]ODV73611.1 Yos1-like protein [Cyberlindnera jadinii NRRL Y-1542]
MFGLGRLFYVILLLVNAVAVLNEERFLNRLGFLNSQPAFGQPETTALSRLMNIVSSVQTVMRMPLIIVNVVVILYELILG